MDECLRNPQTLLFAMSYFCVYVGTGLLAAGRFHVLDTASASLDVSSLPDLGLWGGRGGRDCECEPGASLPCCL